MKRIFNFILFVSLSVSLKLHAEKLPNSELPELVFNTTTEPPFTDTDNKGFLDKLTAEMFKRAGYKIKIIKLPAERGLVAASEGQIDGDLVRISGLSNIYPHLAQMSENILTWEFCALVKGPKKIKSDYQTFRKYKTGLIRGWKIYETKMTGSKNLVDVSNSGELLNLLDLGQIDIALYSRSNGVYMTKKLGLKDIKFLEPCLEKQNMYVYMNKKYIKLIPKLNKILKKMKSDGYYDKLYSKTVTHADIPKSK